MRRPTAKQLRRVRALATRGTVMTPGVRDWQPLLDRGLVEPDPTFTHRDPAPFLHPLRITPAGYRALADELERDGWPEPKKTETEEATDV